MARVKRGTKRRARRKKYLKRTKGFFLTKSKLYQSAQEAANRADRYAYRDRRNKKRQYRRLWIQRIGAAARMRSEEHTSELQSPYDLVCRLLLEKKKPHQSLNYALITEKS